MRNRKEIGISESIGRRFSKREEIRNKINRVKFWIGVVLCFGIIGI
jgi:hypothetical protein